MASTWLNLSKKINCNPLTHTTANHSNMATYHMDIKDTHHIDTNWTRRWIVMINNYAKFINYWTHQVFCYSATTKIQHTCGRKQHEKENKDGKESLKRNNIPWQQILINLIILATGNILPKDQIPNRLLKFNKHTNNT